MARARNIKPGLFKNEVLGVADPLLTILFQGLWVLADREGRLEDRKLRIKAEIFPYRDGVDVDSLLNWLMNEGFILRYETNGSKYIQITNFKKHQNPHKNESPSEIPPPSEDGASSEKIGTTQHESVFVQKTSERAGLIPDSGFRIPDSTHRDPVQGRDANAAVCVDGFKPTEAGKVCKALKAAGVQRVNPGDLRLKTLLEAGATEDEFVGLAPQALGKGDGFAWILGTLTNQRKQVAEDAKAMHQGQLTKGKPPPLWHETNSGIKAKGVELGLGEFSEDKEPFYRYRQRVYEKAGVQA